MIIHYQEKKRSSLRSWLAISRKQVGLSTGLLPFVRGESPDLLGQRGLNNIFPSRIFTKTGAVRSPCVQKSRDRTLFCPRKGQLSLEIYITPYLKTLLFLYVK
jgi:hypothetical protein